MQRNQTKRTLISLVAIAVFLFSMVYASSNATLPIHPVSDSVLEFTYAQDPDPQYEPEAGTHVWWDQNSNSTSDEWSWDHRNWLFGPSPTFEVFHEDGSLLTGDSYAEIGEVIHFVVTVPKNVFTEDADLGRVSVHGWYTTADWNFTANFNMDFDANPYAFDRWMAGSWQYNSTEEFGPPQPSFLNITPEQCSNTSDASNYYIDFAVSFTGDAPQGLYQIDMSVEDTNGNWIGSYNYGSGWDFKGIAVGMHADLAWAHSFGGGYTLQKIDLEGDPLYSVSRGMDFIMRFNISGDEPEFVRLRFHIPSGIDVWVNETGWHDELVTSNGGWQFDEVLETYVWNDTIEVTTLEQVYGEYQRREWVNIGTSEEINVTRLWDYWDDEIEEWVYEIVNETWWIEKEFIFEYNGTHFETYYGYTYWGYPYEEYIPGTWNEEITVLEPIPEDMPIFYELNTSQCSAATIGPEFVVEFIGHFTDEMPVSNMYQNFMFQDEVMGPDNYQYWPATHGEYPKQTQSEYEMAKQIAIETPVTIAKLLRADGTEPTGWMFQIDKGDDFMISGRLQGGGSVADDIDASQLALNAYSGYWTEDEWGWSELTYEVSIDMDGIPTFRAFNRTEKNNYTHGVYEDWILTNSTGWFYAYNETTGMWDWAYGNYTDWQWVEVEGWHWAWWYYNHLTGEWQEKYIPHRSAETVIPADFCTISGFTSLVDEGDLYVTFLVNMTESVPDTNYWWEFAFMNNTWYQDYSSEYGEHEVLSWEREWVYSFDYLGDKVYMEPFVKNQLVYQFTNGSLSSDYMIGFESPYIVLGDEELPIKVRENYDPWSSTTWTEMFFYDHWDPGTGNDYYYYELLNDTKILVTYTDTVYIYNVTTTTGDSFLTAMEWDWGYQSYGTHHDYWVDLNGSVHQGGIEYQRWNLLDFEFHDKVEISYHDEGWFVRYGPTDNIMLISNFWWESLDNTYYMTSLDGNLYQVIYNEMYGHNEAFIDGFWQAVGWFEHYYTAEYDGHDVMLVTHNTHRSWYHENGAELEMPYPGANAEWHDELNRIQSDGGKVPTTKSLVYDGVTYPVYNTTVDDCYVDIEGTTYSINHTLMFHTVANGTDIWLEDSTPVGYQADVGTFDNSLAFTNVEPVQYNTDDMWGWPRMDWDNGYYVVDLFNGTTWIANYTNVMLLFKYDLEGEIFYSMQEWPYWHELGNESWYSYVAINGTEIEVLSPDPLPKMASHLVYTYFNGSHDVYDFMSGTYAIHSWGPSIWAFKIHNATYSGDLFLNMQGGGRELYVFDYLGTPVLATPSYESIHRYRLRWGHALIYGPTPIESSVHRNFYDLVIGVPEWGMWGMQNWATNPDNGALDLDGNLDTTDDQYFVQEEYSSIDSWTHTWEALWTNINWDPNATAWGDEMNIHSWMGVDSFTWTYEWSQSFDWYFAGNMSALTTGQMDAVRDILLTEDEEPRPGYWDIAWMARDVTWEDILADAEANGWDWITSNEQTWTWLSFGVGQNYGTTVLQDEVEHWLNIGMHYEFSGLMIWEDLNDDGTMGVDLFDPSGSELSHYLMPDSVDSVSFVTPGMAFGDSNSSGWMSVDITDEVTWGVTFLGVNGTAFPFTEWGYWGWYDGVNTGSDMRTFDERPTKVRIDELSFLVHFQGYIDESGETLNNYAEVKVDNYVGNWDVDMIGGRSNLENKSLALNYFADVNVQDFAFKANGNFMSGEETVSADTFAFETAGVQFAEMIMGGVTYDWSKNTSAPYDVLSYTTPVGTFRAAFESDSGQSATAWSFSSTMFYVTIGFPEWDGYSVYQDPVFVSYISAHGTESVPGKVEFGAFSIGPTIPHATDTVQVGVDIYADVQVNSADLLYGTDGGNLDQSTPMWQETDTRWVGNIPPYDDGVQVFYKMVVHTDYGDFESPLGSYIVGQGIVGPDGGLDMIVLLGGFAVLVILVVVLARRRRR